MLGVPTHPRRTVTGARSPRVHGCARLRTRPPGVAGEGSRHLQTHGVPPGGAPSGPEGEGGGSTGPPQGGPVARGTSSSGHRGESVAMTAQRPRRPCGQRAISIPVSRRINAGADAGAVGTGGGWWRAVREAGRVRARHRWPRTPSWRMRTQPRGTVGSQKRRIHSPPDRGMRFTVLLWR
jgi:hypothetical protein